MWNFRLCKSGRPNDSSSTDFTILLNECEMGEEDQLFLRNAGITTVAKYAYCVLGEEDLQKDLFCPAGDLLSSALGISSFYGEGRCNVSALVIFPSTAPFYLLKGEMRFCGEMGPPPTHHPMVSG